MILFSHKFKIKRWHNIFLIVFSILFININCRVIIPFKYIQEKVSDLPTPKEVMTSYMSQKIYINIEIGTPKQQIQMPIQFNDNILYILTGGKYDSAKSSTFKQISEDMEYTYNHGFTIFTNCSDTFYFLKSNKKKDFNEVKLVFSHVLDGNKLTSGGFGMQIYPWDNNNEDNFPVPLKLLKNSNAINNYLWSVYFNQKGNNIGDEGFILLGDYPHDLDGKFEIYDKDEFDINNLRKVYDHSNQKSMNNEIQMSEIYFYNKNKKDTTNQKFFNNLDIKEFITDITIPQVSIYYVSKFEYNFGGILVPEYFNAYLAEQVFNSYIQSGSCFTEKVNDIVSNCNFFYCKNKNSIIKEIKKKIPTIIFSQDNLKYNFTINVDELIYEKGDFVYFLIFYSSSQKNKWTLGRPFLKKYPFVFNPDTKDISFYSSFLLTGIKYKTVVIIAIILSIIFIIIGLFVGRYKYKMNKIKKQQALEMSHNDFISDYKSIEMKNEIGNKLYKD